MEVTTHTQAVASHNVLLRWTVYSNPGGAVGTAVCVDDCIAIYVSDLHEPVWQHDFSLQLECTSIQSHHASSCLTWIPVWMTNRFLDEAFRFLCSLVRVCNCLSYRKISVCENRALRIICGPMRKQMTRMELCKPTKYTFQINVLIQFFLSSTCFEHLMFIIRKTILYMQPYMVGFSYWNYNKMLHNISKYKMWRF